jgi:hypothetical protein
VAGFRTYPSALLPAMVGRPNSAGRVVVNVGLYRQDGTVLKNHRFTLAWNSHM